MTRRTFLAGAAASPPAERPDIIVILADDMGYSDAGCYGSEIRTPHIDGLAARGIRFTHFRTAARCCPTRASLLTGVHPHEAGVGHMDQDRGLAAYRGHIRADVPTLPEMLRADGYTCLMAGKWHLGEVRPHWPTDRGFHRFWGLLSGGSSYFRLDPDRRMAEDEKQIVPNPENFYVTDAVTSAACRLLDEHAASRAPLFLYLAYTAPHYPLHAPADEVRRYHGIYDAGWDAVRERRHARMIESGLVQRRWAAARPDGDVPRWEFGSGDAALRMSVYAAQVSRMDTGIGRVLKTLERIGRARNALVLFLSDNGASAEEVDRGRAGAEAGSPESWTSYGRGWARAGNTPFRGYKRELYEGGLASPLIAAWPGRIARPGSVRHDSLHVADIVPTCLEAARVKPNARLRGASLLPAFSGESVRRPGRLYWEHEGRRAALDGNWKAIRRPGAAWELYDLEADRCERNDVAREQPRVAARLAAAWESWAAEAGVVEYAKLPQPIRRTP